MIVKSLILRNFRLYPEVSFAFGSKLNVFYGKNATGKTSILEAIQFFVNFRSFRTPYLADLISKEQKYFSAELRFSRHGIDQKIYVYYSPKEKKVIYNSTNCPSFSSLLGLLKGVIIVPEDIEIIKGSPQSRREFLDIFLMQIDPMFVHHLNRYQRAMKQRNTLLKLKRKDGIENWEHEMALSANYISLKRNELTQQLVPIVEKIYYQISNENFPLAIRYKSNLKVEKNNLYEEYIRLFCSNRNKEMEIGLTMEGPHKDDITFKVDKAEIKHFGSEGQLRTLVIALKLAQWIQLKNITGMSPLAFIDDISIHLDKNRKEALNVFLEEFDQTFITTTEVPISQTANNRYFLIT
ncbi:DNA replication and repair protein RecF [Candidatus Rubidus massiliensis]|nr:DNA replication and repair protein RecF [Candidatus Rubidus massiliensis]